MKFEAGDVCLLIDAKGRRYLIELKVDGSFHSHLGVVMHDQIIGREEGEKVVSAKGRSLLALRPRMVDYVLKMKRGAQVVYPKDVGSIVVYGDIGPGNVVLEAGTGSGALTIALVRAVGPTGRVISVERRADHADHARGSIERFFGGSPPTLELRSGDVEDVIADIGPDRIVLDLPEPWHAARVAATSLTAGGVFIAYLPTVPQIQTLVEALAETGAYAEVETFETLRRTWHIDGRSVRPDHRMVGHTGFITVARRVVPGNAEQDRTEDAAR